MVRVIGSRQWDWLGSLSYWTLFIMWGTSVLIFAGVYTTLSYVPGHGPSTITSPFLLTRFLDSLYYSIITATSTGYGDIVPLGVSRIFAALQSVTELFLFALFVAKFISHKQDAAISEVHKLSFELLFRNVREDFYLARRDFGHIIENARTNHELSQTDTERLAIAFQHITSLLHEIPAFYRGSSELYVIDPRREVLLLESVQRTMTRITKLVSTFDAEGIQWKEHPISRGELHEIIATLDTLIPLWRKHSRHQNHDAFMRIMSVRDELRDQLG